MNKSICTEKGQQTLTAPLNPFQLVIIIDKKGWDGTPFAI